MNFVGWLALAGAGLCAAIASILLKLAASLALPLLSPRVATCYAAALGTYGVGFLLYGYCLRYFQVSTAYVSMVAIAAILLFLYSWFRGESVQMSSFIGAIMVIGGVFLIVGRGAP